MRVIYKLKITGPAQEFSAPAGAKAISARVDLDGVQPVLYLLCQKGANVAKHQVFLFSVGQNILDDAGDFVGTLTFKTESGPTTVHVFHKQLTVALSS